MHFSSCFYISIIFIHRVIDAALLPLCGFTHHQTSAGTSEQLAYHHTMCWYAKVTWRCLQSDITHKLLKCCGWFHVQRFFICAVMFFFLFVFLPQWSGWRSSVSDAHPMSTVVHKLFDYCPTWNKIWKQHDISAFSDSLAVSPAITVSYIILRTYTVG